MNTIRLSMALPVMSIILLILIRGTVIFSLWFLVLLIKALRKYLDSIQTVELQLLYYYCACSVSQYTSANYYLRQK